MRYLVSCDLDYKYCVLISLLTMTTGLLGRHFWVEQILSYSTVSINNTYFYFFAMYTAIISSLEMKGHQMTKIYIIFL